MDIFALELLRIVFSLIFVIYSISVFTKRTRREILTTLLRTFVSALTARGRVSREWFTYTASILVITKSTIDGYGKQYGTIKRILSFWFTGFPQSLAVVSDIIPYILWSLPFIWLGFGLCVMRLRDAGQPRIFAPLFFLPAINILFFIGCLMLPTVADDYDNKIELSSKGFLRRVVPQSRLGTAAFTVLVCVCVGVIGVVAGAYGFGNYGGPLFLGLPFFIGFLSALLYGVHEPRTLKECVSIAMLSMVITAVTLIAFLIEGIICIASLLPIALACSVIGACVGFGVQLLPPGRRSPLRSSLMCGLTLAIGVTIPVDDSAVLSSTTVIQINRPPAEVWPHVIAFSEIAPPKEWLFLKGVAYPIRARIEGSGVGAIRYCEFSTGPFVEPITVWNEPRELRFSVTETPPALTEWNPLGVVIAPHLSGYFQSLGGQFLLKEVGPGITQIQATTWYTHKVAPVWYWELISDRLLHLIHLRVLEHIKKEAENR